MSDITLPSTLSEGYITSHFRWEEILVSSLYPELIRKVVLTERDQINYYHLIETVLEPERTNSTIPTIIRQGKRSWEMYKRLVKDNYSPSPTSQHFCENPFDCAIDFQKVVYHKLAKYDDKTGKSSRVDISSSRISTLSAFHWIQQNCPYGFGQMYYNTPKDKSQIGFVHLGSRTPSYKGAVWTK